MDNKEDISYGHKLVGIQFNPANSDNVHDVKSAIAKVIDILEYRSRTGGSVTHISRTIYDAAIADLLRGQMMAVKYLTNNH